MNTDDRWAITETLSRVGHVVDAGALDEMDTVFAADVVYDMSAVGMPVVRGTDAARELALQLGARNPIAHHVTNVVIVQESDGRGEVAAVDDQVAVDSKGLMLMADGTLTSVVHHDVLRRGADGWRIARRVIVPQGSSREGRGTQPAGAPA